MSSNSYLRISPTSTYVIFTENLADLTLGYMYKVTLPDAYMNNEISAKIYFLNRFDSKARIVACLPFEVWSDGVAARI